MSKNQYRVVLTGKFQEGATRESVAGALLKLYKGNKDRVRQLLDGKPHLLKATDEKMEAKRLLSLLQRTGAEVRLLEPVARSEESPSAEEATTQTTTSAQPDKPADSPPARSSRIEIPDPARSEEPGREVLKIRFMQKLVRPFSAMLFFPFVALYPLMLILLLVPLIYSPIIGALTDSIESGIVSTLIYLFIALLLLLIFSAFTLPLTRQSRVDEYLEPARGSRDGDLYELVYHLCEEIGAPLPDEILFSSAPRIHFGYKQGVVGLLQNRNQLIIGMPILVGCSSRDFAALLIAEMGHYRYGARLSYLLRTTNRWMSELSYGDGNLDNLLSSQSAKGGTKGTLAEYAIGLNDIVRIVVVFWMRLCQSLSSGPLSALTRNAATAEAYMVGTSTAVQAQQWHSKLQVAWGRTLYQIEEAFHNHKPMPERLFKRLADLVARLPEGTIAQIEARDERQRENQHLPYLADYEYQELLIEQNWSGYFACETPSLDLVRRSTWLARQLSFDHIRKVMKLPITHNMLASEPYSAVETFPQGRAKLFTPDFIPLVAFTPKAPMELNQAGSAMELKMAWSASAAQLQKDRISQKKNYLALKEADNILFATLASELLTRSGFVDFSLTFWKRGEELEELQQDCRMRENDYEEAAKKLQDLYKGVARRIELDLTLLAHPECKGQITGAEKFIAEANQLCDLQGRLASLVTPLYELRQHTYLLENLLCYQGGSRRGKLDDRIAELCADIEAILTNFGVVLKSLSIPFVGASSQKNLAAMIIPDVSRDGPPKTIVNIALDTIHNLAGIHEASVGRLCAIALIVEHSLGLEPESK